MSSFCDPMGRGAWQATVHGIPQARTLEWVAISFSRDLPNPGIEPRSPALQVDSLPSGPPWKPIIHTSHQTAISPETEAPSSISILPLPGRGTQSSEPLNPAADKGEGVSQCTTEGILL